MSKRKAAPVPSEDSDPKILSAETGAEIDFLSHPISAAHLQALGDICIQQSALEELMRDLIHRALGTDLLTAHTVTDRMQMSSMLRLAKSLLYLRFPDGDGRAEVDALMEKVSKVEPERNEDIHAQWTGEGTVAYRFSWNRGKSPHFKVTKRTPDQMHESAKAIGRARYAITKFIMLYYSKTPDPSGQERKPGEPRRRKK